MHGIATQQLAPCMRRNAVEKKTVLENLDLVLLTMDETVDGGCVAWTSPTLAHLPAGMFVKMPVYQALMCLCQDASGDLHQGA